MTAPGKFPILLCSDNGVPAEVMFTTVGEGVVLRLGDGDEAVDALFERPTVGTLVAALLGHEVEEYDS